MRRTVLSTAAATALLVGGISAATATTTTQDDPRIPGGCYVWSYGGWLGGGCAPGMEPWFPADAPTLERIGGEDRFDTAALFSEATFEPGVATVYVVNGLTGLPDALAAGAATDGPILLVTATGVPEATAAELVRLDPQRVVIVGGVGAVPDDVAAQVRVYASR